MESEESGNAVVVPAWLGVILALTAIFAVVRFVPLAREVAGGAVVGCIAIGFVYIFWASLGRPTILACVGNVVLVAFAAAVVAVFAELVGENGGSALRASAGVVVGGLVALIALCKS